MVWEFQAEDIAKLEGQKSAAIASEMGTGKTYEGIMLDEIWNSDGKRPTLIVAPRNTFDGWQAKYGERAPSTDVVTIDRKNQSTRASFSDSVRRRSGDVFLMHWEALRLMPELAENHFGLIIADEAHRASNRKNQQTLALKKLSAEHKLAMSGTLSGDQAVNLWSPLNWLYPKDFRSYWQFRKRYCVEETDYARGQGYSKIVGVQNVQELHDRIDTYWVRHLKREACCVHHPKGVMPWLPPKTYDHIWVELSPTQKRIYEQMRKEMVAWVNEHEDTPLVASVVVAQMVRLSQIALATPTIGEGGRVSLSSPSSKIDTVKELLKDHDNKQFVVFAQSKQGLYLAQDEFRRGGISCEVFSGDTSDANRDAYKLGFQRGDYQAFLGVIDAVGEGVDGLQYATDTAIFLNRHPSSTKNQQAEDRLDRGGQENAVNIIDVMARGTLDFGRLQHTQMKWEWIKQMLGDPAKAQAEVLANGP